MSNQIRTEVQYIAQNVAARYSSATKHGETVPKAWLEEQIDKAVALITVTAPRFTELIVTEKFAAATIGDKIIRVYPNGDIQIASTIEPEAEFLSIIPSVFPQHVDGVPSISGENEHVHFNFFDEAWLTVKVSEEGLTFDWWLFDECVHTYSVMWHELPDSTREEKIYKVAHEFDEEATYVYEERSDKNVVILCANDILTIKQRRHLADKIATILNEMELADA